VLGDIIDEMSEQMWSLEHQEKILKLLQAVFKKKKFVNVWQRTETNTIQARGHIETIDEHKCIIQFVQKIGKDHFSANETLFVHCEGINVIFKKNNFVANDGSIAFKTPSKLLIKEKRRIERLKFKYQDYKEVEFSFEKAGQLHKSKHTLLDISILGIGFLAPKELSDLLGVGDEINITMMSDQNIDSENFKAKIVNCIDNDKLDRLTEDYIKFGVEFIEPLEMVVYQSKDLVAPKTQRRK
jgi:hypothetical protein